MLDSERWNAVLASDKRYDGIFFYGVKSTGIFCRPSCASKPPRRENIVFFNNREDAERAGFRPCKRCRPDLNTYNPAVILADEAKAIIDCTFAERAALKEKLDALGITRRHLSELFEKQFDMSPEQYIAQIRFQRAKELLNAGYRVIDVAFEVGMESSASFATFFKKQAGISPTEYILQKEAERPRCFCETPVGVLRIEENKFGITSIQFTDEKAESALPSGTGIYLKDATSQLSEYFTKKRNTFDIPLSITGSEFQKKVWSALRTIPYGETRSYQQVAEAVGNRDAARAVGMANNRNPIAIVIPCHRVVGKNGTLVGYAGGIERKQFLLELEAEK